MNATVEEWISKAEGDYHTAVREMEALYTPNYDAACFHSQQCVEKLIKAILIREGVLAPRTHDLVRLDQLLKDTCEKWSCNADDLRFLTLAAVHYRYPGESADEDDARRALDVCTRTRKELLELLGAWDA